LHHRARSQVLHHTICPLSSIPHTLLHLNVSKFRNHELYHFANFHRIHHHLRE
jgi:hypothetical protein